MFNIQQDIRSLTDFKRNTANFLKQIRRHHRPLALTVNGRAQVVIQDAQSYQRLLEMAERFESISAVQEGMAQAENGKDISLELFDKRMRKKHGLSR